MNTSDSGQTPSNSPVAPWSAEDPRVIALAWGAILVLITVLAYIPAFQNGYIWDDDEYVVNNPALQTAEGLSDIWFKPGATPQYYPLVFTAFWIQRQFLGDSPVTFHAVNILLHGLTAVLIWRVLLKFKLRHGPAWLCAAVFAVHPVHVESVAWITELKNVLMGLFYFLTLLAFLKSDELEANPPPVAVKKELPAGDAATGQEVPPPLIPELNAKQWYFLAIGFFVCAMLSKTVAATLPVALAVLLWWKNGAVTPRDLKRLVPLVAIALPLGLMTVYLERSHVGAQGIDWTLTPVERVLIAGKSIWFYIGKLIVPSQLTFVYPRWTPNASDAMQWLYPAGVVAAIALLWFARERIGRGPLAAFLFFVISVSPAIGFVDVYPHRYSYVADHFQYIASVGIITLVVGAIATFGSMLVQRFGMPFAAAIAAVPLLGFGVNTALQTLAYENHQTLWEDTIAKNPDAWLAHNNLAIIYSQQGNIDLAREHFEKALAINDRVLEIRKNYGDMLMSLGKAAEASEQYKVAIELIHPQNVRAGELYNQYGEALALVGKTEESRAAFQKAVDFYRPVQDKNPEVAYYLYQLAIGYQGVGDYRRAFDAYSEVSKLNEKEPGLYERMATCALKAGKTDLAQQVFVVGLKIQGGAPELLRLAAWTWATNPDPKMRNAQNALIAASKAVTLTGERGPRYLDAYAAARANNGDFDEAVKAIDMAIDLVKKADIKFLLPGLESRKAMYLRHEPYREDPVTGRRATTQPSTQPSTQPDTQPATQPGEASASQPAATQAEPSKGDQTPAP